MADEGSRWLAGKEEEVVHMGHGLVADMMALRSVRCGGGGRATARWSQCFGPSDEEFI